MPRKTSGDPGIGILFFFVFVLLTFSSHFFVEYFHSELYTWQIRTKQLAGGADDNQDYLWVKKLQTVSFNLFSVMIPLLILYHITIELVWHPSFRLLFICRKKNFQPILVLDLYHK